MTATTPSTPDAARPPLGKPRCDTSDMLHIHGLFRRQFVDVPVLVRAVPDRDHERTTVVADHVATLLDGLHHHHHLEDALLWDTLEQRAPACALHVGLMRSQHAAIATMLEDLQVRLPRWRTTAAAADAAAVADALEEIRAALLVHLGQEEEAILPTASSVMSQREWDQIRKSGMSEMGVRGLLLQLGWIVDAIPEPERAGWLRENLPAPIRLAWYLWARRQFEAHRALVYGGVIA